MSLKANPMSERKTPENPGVVIAKLRVENARLQAELAAEREAHGVTQAANACWHERYIELNAELAAEREAHQASIEIREPKILALTSECERQRAARERAGANFETAIQQYVTDNRALLERAERAEARVSELEREKAAVDSLLKMPFDGVLLTLQKRVSELEAKLALRQPEAREGWEERYSLLETDRDFWRHISVVTEAQNEAYRRAIAELEEKLNG